MRVTKRGNRGLESVKFDKITQRIAALAKDLPDVSPEIIAQKVIQNIYDKIHVSELDVISAGVASAMQTIHPNYNILAGYILISNLHKTTPPTFSLCMWRLFDGLEIISEKRMAFIRKYGDELDLMIEHPRDYMFGYNAIKTLEKQFLHKINGEVCDRPQYMYMRVAIEVVVERDISDQQKLELIREYYNGLSTQKFIFATPTNFNSCTKHAQLNSCFLLSTEDSIEEIMRTITNSALISKRAGGIGIAMHKIRTAGSVIKGTNGITSGVFPQLKIYDANVLCWNQGGGKRKGAVAIYVEPWNADFLNVMELKLSQGSDEIRARNLFYATWVPDLFMLRLRDNADWSLFSDDTAPGLSEVFDGMLICKNTGHCDNVNYIDLVRRGVLTESDVESPLTFLDDGVSDSDGDSGGDVNDTTQTQPRQYRRVNVFTNLYCRYEREGRARNIVKASVIENAICLSQRESGGPYVLFKDHVNRQSNQQNIGTIQSSNLCAEIVEWHSKDSYACCSLASLNLTKYVTDLNDTQLAFDFEALMEATKLVVRGLDNNVSMNDYPVPECSDNALKFRPIAIGVQGLADVFIKMRMPFLSEAAEKLDQQIFETIYYAALSASADLAEETGSYSKFEGSPLSRGILRFDLWEENQQRLLESTGSRLELCKSNRYDWDALRQRLSRGVRCSLHIALMPTVTTSHILGNNEAFEPIPGNMYTKNTLAGKLTITNHYLINDLIRLGKWNENVKNKIINNNGSVQGIDEIPKDLQELYLTVWEMKQSQLMRRAALRQAYIDQSQSLNIHTTVNTDARLRGIFRAGWQYGLCTGSYYIRTKSTVDPMKNNIAESVNVGAGVNVGVNVDTGANNNNIADGANVDAVCEIGCTSCGS